MGNIEINNEIVLLRQSVRQARICVINNLVKEAKRLRSNRGNEKQLEKNKNKADKLLREVVALKRVKDDEISKFGIVNVEKLQEMLQNPNVDDGTRAMVKVIRYKTFNSKILNFTKKFPDYKEYISWKKKKHPLKRGKSNIDDRTQQGNLKHSQSDTNSKMNSAKDVDCDVSYDRVQGIAAQENASSQSKCKESRKRCVPSNSKENSCDSRSNKETENVTKNSVAKVISEEAAVKRFAEILEETSVKERNNECPASHSEQPFNKFVEIPKHIDDFFLNSDEDTSCSNVELLSRENSSSGIVSTLNDNSFAEFRKKSGKEKFGRDKTINERRNYGKGKMEYQNFSRDENTEVKGSITGWKQKKKGTRTRNESTRENIEGICTTAKDKQLHPSWVAKKKQQEIMKQGFQGKKIQFDEL